MCKLKGWVEFGDGGAVEVSLWGDVPLALGVIRRIRMVAKEMTTIPTADLL